MSLGHESKLFMSREIAKIQTTIEVFAFLVA
jgi:hypothetical protein